MTGQRKLWKSSKLFHRHPPPPAPLPRQSTELRVPNQLFTDEYNSFVPENENPSKSFPPCRARGGLLSRVDDDDRPTDHARAHTPLAAETLRRDDDDDDDDGIQSFNTLHSWWWSGRWTSYSSQEVAEKWALPDSLRPKSVEHPKIVCGACGLLELHFYQIW